MQEKYVAGIDYGSDSVRVLITNAKNGEKVSEGVCAYPRWAKQMYCDSEQVQYRQHALDYIEGLEQAMAAALAGAPEGIGDAIEAIAFDTTGSTPGPVDKNGVPLCLLPEFAEEPDAMFHLWKDHTAKDEAIEINAVFSSGDVDYTQYQGIYSSEWFWAKILHTTRKNEKIRAAAWTWTEHIDWISGLMVGNIHPDTIAHCSCAAGHKALWHSAFGGLPDRARLASMDPYLGDVSDRYVTAPVPAGTCLGTITEEWAKTLHINPEAKVAAGSFDAHAGGVGAGVGLHTLVEVVGTSTVEMLVDYPEATAGKDMRAFCGQAEDSIVPGYVGLEMSQPAFGDVYAWYKRMLLWPLSHIEVSEKILSAEQKQALEAEIDKKILPTLEKYAMDCWDEDVIALDWFNGRRYPYLNESVKAAVGGLTLATDAPSFYCALIKGTVMGCRRVYQSLVDNGIVIERIIAVGGIANKSPLIMQMMSDAIGLPIMVSKETQAVAKGSAIYASVAAGYFASVEDGQKVFCDPYEANYFPNADRKAFYDNEYARYLSLGEKAEEMVPA